MADRKIQYQGGEQMSRCTVEVREGYEALWLVLTDALEQAQAGKGAARHQVGSEGIVRQPIGAITHGLGLGFPLGQWVKKLDEASRMPPAAARAELLGAVVYAAVAVLELDGELGE